MPTSLARVQANRRNAQLSTGPRTAAGRARSSLNAVSHGLRGESILVRGEDGECYEAVRRQFEVEHRPATALEVVLVDQLAQLAWKLRRLAAAEAELLDQQFAAAVPGLSPRSAGQAILKDIKGRNPVMLKLQLYQLRIERALYRAITELRRLRAERASAEASAIAADTANAIRPNEPNARPKRRPALVLAAAAASASPGGVRPVESSGCHGSTGRVSPPGSSFSSTGGGS